MADLRNFARWDPGVPEVRQVAGDGPGVDSVFDVTVRGPGSPVFRYETVEYEPPRRVFVRARTRLFTSADEIAVAPDGGGSVVTYDARLHFNGPLRPLSPLLWPLFRRIAGRAASGLREALESDRS